MVMSIGAGIDTSVAAARGVQTGAIAGTVVARADGQVVAEYRLGEMLESTRTPSSAKICRAHRDRLVMEKVGAR